MGGFTDPYRRFPAGNDDGRKTDPRAASADGELL
jgi:hypothetical protein